jgi:hypothetical protein
VADRPLEIIAVLMLGVATLGSAWCGYQATRWNSEESDLARDAADDRVESSRLFGLAVQRVSYDSNIVALYAAAVSDGNERLQQFYREALIRQEFLPTLDRWEAEIAAGATSLTNLLQDPDYLDAQFAEYQEVEASAEATTVESQEAGDNAEKFVQLTLILAGALFFAGVTTSFRWSFARVILLMGSGLLIAYAASQIVDLPVT